MEMPKKNHGNSHDTSKKLSVLKACWQLINYVFNRATYVHKNTGCNKSVETLNAIKPHVEPVRLTNDSFLLFISLQP